MTTTLRGMTWDHPRGYDPMVAAATRWHEQTGVTIRWEKRSLQDFETFPVEELARQFDLIVIDHPHVGQIIKEACLAPLDLASRATECTVMQQHSVGQSYDSYTFAGRQCAFPIDAAAQVQVYRPDRLAGPVDSWAAAVELARAGRVLLPLRAPHSLMSFYTLAANLGTPCNTTGPQLITPAAGARVLATLRQITDHLGPEQFDMDPIAALERLATGDDDFALIPLAYGYASYALAGFRPARLKFANIPAAGSAGPIGSALGGTGIAVSAFSASQDAAIDFAYWLASGETQRTLYALSGGQPGHALAWDDATVNAAVDGFYRDTRATLEGAWVRPRHDGYMAFQDQASIRLNAALHSGEAAADVIADLNTLFAGSF